MDADDRLCAGGDGDLRLSRPGYRYSYPSSRTATIAPAHRHGDVHAQLFRQQFDTNGVDIGHRLPGR